VVGYGFGGGVYREGAGVGEHAFEQGRGFGGGGEGGGGFRSVATDDHDDHAPVATVVYIALWMRAHDVGRNLFANVGDELPSAEKFLRERCWIVMLRRNVEGNSENRNDEKSKAPHSISPLQ